MPCVGLILEENTLEHNTTDKMAVWICQNVSAQKCKHANQDNLFTNPHTYICSIYTSQFSQRVSVLLAYQHVMEQNTQLHLQAGISMLYVLRAWMS